MTRPTSLLSLTLLLMTAGMAHAEAHEGVSWQDAVAELAFEKTRAETCVSLAKQNFDAAGAALAQVQLDYGAAKAEMDAIVGGLVVVLTVEEAPEDFSAFEERLTRAVGLREGFCETVVARLPQDEKENTKGVLLELAGKGIASLISAVKDIYIYHQEEDVLERQTIQTQVEASRWRDFADIPG